MDAQEGAPAQINVKVKIVEIDRGQFQVKNRWEKGDCVTVQIEGHATVSMLKQRVALLVAAHEKWQTMKFNGAELTEPAARLDSIEGMGEGATIDLYAIAPKEKEEDLGELSDDPEALTAEADPMPPLPDDNAMEVELTEEQEDAQNKCKGEAAEALEDGDKKKALEKLTEAILIGNPNAMLLAKRGEILLKMKRPQAAIADATAALKKNPDSVKALRLRAKAGRFLSQWDQAVADFAKAQAIDYDDDVVDMHKFCTKRKTWHSKMAVRTENAEKQAKADAKEAEIAAKKAAAKEAAAAQAAKEKASQERREAREKAKAEAAAAASKEEPAAEGAGYTEVEPPVADLD